MSGMAGGIVQDLRGVSIATLVNVAILGGSSFDSSSGVSGSSLGVSFGPGYGGVYHGAEYTITTD